MTNPLGMTLKPAENGERRTSRLDQIQAQFRQKLDNEKEAKLRDMYERSRQDADRRIERITGGRAAAPAGGAGRERRPAPGKPPLPNGKRLSHLSPISGPGSDPPPGARPAFLNRNNNNSDFTPAKSPAAATSGSTGGLNSTYSLADSRLRPVQPLGEADNAAPTVRPKKGPLTPRRDAAGSSREDHGTPPRLPPVKRQPQRRRAKQEPTKVKGIEPANMKFLDKILAKERQLSARRRQEGGDAPQLDPLASYKRREAEILDQINRKMAELEVLRSENQSLGEKSDGGSRPASGNATRNRQSAGRTGSVSAPRTDVDEEFDPNDNIPVSFHEPRPPTYSPTVNFEEQQMKPSNMRTQLPQHQEYHRSNHSRLSDEEDLQPQMRQPALRSGRQHPMEQPSQEPKQPPRQQPRQESRQQLRQQPKSQQDRHSSNHSRLSDEEDLQPQMQQPVSQSGLQQPREQPKQRSRQEPKQERRQQLRQQPQPQLMHPADLSEDDTNQMIHSEDAPVGPAKYDTQPNLGEFDETVMKRLVECGNCGRRFAEDRIGKHEAACTSQKVRRQYDTKGHRVMGQDHATYALNDKYQKEEPKKAGNWRAKREEFIRNIRAARGEKVAPAAAVPDPDYVQCQHCGRRFNEAAAERHIPKCKDLKTRAVGQKMQGNSVKTIAPPSRTRRR